MTELTPVILSKLRERLFDFSRRNRLLQFRSTGQCVHLTQASVPLSRDPSSIGPDQILTWNARLQQSVACGEPIALNQCLNFDEAIYLESQFRRLITETKRDEAEYGFAQLRLVPCFLNWTNDSRSPHQTYRSPMLLIPVHLRRKKGIRDTFFLEASSATAEVNPLIRHLFEQLYAVRLPESIDLAKTSLDEFYDEFTRQIHAAAPTVELARYNRPCIEELQASARRRRQRYCRRAERTGRGVRNFLGLNYSYDPANFDPLGIKLFARNIKPPRDRPMTPPVDPYQAERQRPEPSRPASAASPGPWVFDLCSVTLSNFRYRRMSLVRDYETLLENATANDAFAAAFSLAPPAVDPEPIVPRPIEDRYDVVPCDPTQAHAIAEARRGKSFIIQGPPGTGKSQTITNLIADYVARGKRVLFVCEKRAAIDVVYARLRQCGLADLCCLIHDSQSDKKQFVMELKQSYEKLLEPDCDDRPTADRAAAVAHLLEAVEPLRRFDQGMRQRPASVGIPLRQLLDECILLRPSLPEMDVLVQERLPDYAAWADHKSAIDRFGQVLRGAVGDEVWARQPWRIVSPRVALRKQRLTALVAVARQALSKLEQTMKSWSESGVPRPLWDPLDRARQTIDYAQRIRPIAQHDLMHVFDREHPDAEWLAIQRAKFAQADLATEAAERETVHWLNKLSSIETACAWEQAENLADAALPWLKPTWWRLRRVLKRSYDFQAHQIPPSWSQVLGQLSLEHQCRWEQEQLWRQTAERLGVRQAEVEELLTAIDALVAWLPEQLVEIGALHERLSKSSAGRQIIARIAAAADDVTHLLKCLREFCDGVENLLLDELQDCLVQIADNPDIGQDCLSCLEVLATCPEAVTRCLQTMPYAPRAVEAAVADRGLAEMYRRDRQLARFTAQTRREAVETTQQCYERWVETNAAFIRDRVGQSFLEKQRTVGRPTTRLTSAEKAQQQRYRRGRGELQHEFGKQMRYKAIRDLVAGESGEVIDDLKPVWLMSPLSISDTLPLATGRFDVVIFDEASQITLEEAVPALFRASQTIVVGDQMQLPPTSFFTARQSRGDLLACESKGKPIRYDLSSDSLLSHAAKNLPATMLGWHYRSRSETLISFSNWAFYEGRLFTVPEESRGNIRREPIVASAAAGGRVGAAATLDRPVSFHRLTHGRYERRRNQAEAGYIAELVRALLLADAKSTLGVVAFSEAQQDEIDGALERLADHDCQQFRNALDREFDRREEGQFQGLFVKNLENIQGDERDIVILSVCYGPRPDGRMLMNFGPINQGGGQKRLNVAFSRAKRHMAVVCSFDATEITNEKNEGANCLKHCLRYAEAVSAGDATQADKILTTMAPWVRGLGGKRTPHRDIVAEQLADALITAGFLVDRSVGQSVFQCDLAVYREEDRQYRLGILVDNHSYYEQTDLLERDLMRPRLLEAFGWQVEFVLAKDWYAEPDRVLARLVATLEEPRLA